MTDRALQICIGISFALHLLVLGHGLVAERADAVAVPSEPEPVRIRLRGPETKRVEVEAPSPASPPRPTQRPPAPVARPESTRPAPTPRVQAQPTPAPESAPAQAQTPEAKTMAARAPAEPVTQDLARLAPPSEAVPDPAAAETPSSIALPDVAAAPNALAPTTGRNDEDEDLLSRYAGTVRARIEGRKHYPAFARKRSVEGSVAARVAIGRDGRLESVEFESGAQPLLRKATEDAIRSAAPYPAPPHGPLTIELSLDYSLRDAS